MSVNSERPTDPKIELRGRALGFVAGAMGVTSILKIAIQLVMLPLMARILGPGEFGLYALALPTVVFFQMLADAGLGNSIARESEASEAVWSTAFWLLHGFALLLMLAIIAWSFVLARLSHEPRLPPLMATLSVSLLLLASAIIPGARLARRARMVIGPTIELISALAGAALGLVMATHGFGAWSLVLQYLAALFARAVMLNLVAPKPPSFQFRLDHLSGHIAVGGAIVGSKMAEFLGRMFENVILRASMGAGVLGTFSLSNQMPRFLCEAVTNPVWSALYVQTLHRSHRDGVEVYYRLSRLLGVILFPLTILGAIVIAPLVPVLLGPAWAAVTPIIAILLPSFAFSYIGGQASAPLYARGRSDISLWTISGLSAARLGAVGLSHFVGVLGLAGLIAGANIVYGFSCVFAAADTIESDPMVLFKDVCGPLISAALSGAGLALFLARSHGSVAVALAGVLLASLLYVGLLFSFDRSRFSRDLGLLRSMMRGA